MASLANELLVRHAPTRRRLRLLYVGDAALARECLGRPGGSIEVVAADLPYDLSAPAPTVDLLFIEHGATGSDALAILERLAAHDAPIPVIFVADWDETLAVRALQLGASDYVVKSRASFRAVYFRLHRLIAHSALIDEQARLRAEQADSIERDRATREDLVRSVAEARTARQSAEDALGRALATLKQVRHDRLADAVAAARELAQRELSFAARVADATSTAQALQQQLAARDASLHGGEERVRGLEAALASELTARQVLETKLVEAEVSRQAAEDQRFADAAAIEERIAHVHAEFAGRLAEMGRARDIVERRLTEATEALQQARLDRAADAAASAQHLADREAALLVEISSAARAQEHLEQRLSDASNALRSVEERVAAANGQLAESRLELAQTEERHASELAHAEASFTDARVRYEERLAEAASIHAALQGQLLAADARLQDLRERHTADIGDAALRLSEAGQIADARLAQEAEARTRVENQLAETVAALTQLEQQAAAEREAARAEATVRQAEYDAERARDANDRQVLEAGIAESEAAWQRALEQHASELGAAARQQAALESDLACELRDRQALQAELAESRAERAHAVRQHASEIAQAADRLEAHQQQTETWLVDAAAVANRLEVGLTDAAAALERAEQRSAFERQAATEEAARRHVEFEARLADEIAVREEREQQLRTLAARLETTRQQHDQELADATTRLSDHQQQTDTWLVDAAAVASRLEAQLIDSAAALERAEQQAAFERQSANEEASRRLAEFQARLADEVALREEREQLLRELAARLEITRREHDSELADAATRLSVHRQQTETWLVDAAAVASRLEARLADATASRERAEQQWALERDAARDDVSRRQAEFEGQLAAEVAFRERREAELAEALAAAEQQASDRQHAASEVAAAREAALETELLRAVTERHALATALADAEAARRHEDAQHASEMHAAAADMASLRLESEERLALFVAARQHGVALEGRSAAERSEWTRIHAEAQDRLQQLQREIEGVRHSLVGAVEQSLRQEHTHQEERAEFNRAWTALEGELARQRAEHGALQQTLAEARTTANENLARVANDRAHERAALEALIAERDGELQALAARKREADETAAAALADFQQRTRVAGEKHRTDQLTISQLESSVTRVSRELDVMRRDRDALSVRSAERIETLETRIAAIQVESRRHFGDMPVAMCRCSVDGAVTQANHALTRLLGYTRPEDLQKLDLGEAVFESGDELQWIVTRCLTSRATESIDTTWKKRNGSRIIVRLMAVPAAADAVDLIAEDVTRIRTLEEKLRNAQRMESVARYGSEVAVTCHSLLRHVKQEGQQWLARMESDTVRYQGELLFDDVTRAAGFLQQFAAYGDEQKNAPEVVDVNTLLRDLEPVLKRVAGDHIDFVLAQPRARLNLDVEARRVERMLVNIAAYSRERMPLGGRVMIDVQSVVVNREFVTRYPNVRPGAHVLLTVSEERSSSHGLFPEVLRTTAAVGQDGPATQNPGVDLGTLQALVSDCGGHLWIMAEPSGNMVLKIHVPRRALDRAERALPFARPRGIQRAFGARH